MAGFPAMRRFREMKKHKKFYRNGLYFECTGCGNCCTKTDGFVYLTEPEAREIAELLDISEAEFLARFVDVQVEDDHFALRSRENGDCIFLVEERCTVYPARPQQCRTYPFWPENVRSAYRWRMVARECPGIGQGKWYSAEEVEALLAIQRKRTAPGSD